MATFLSTSTKKAIGRIAFGLALVAGSFLALPKTVQTQTGTLIYGMLSGAPKAITADSSGNVNVTIGSGTVPIANGGTGAATAAATTVFGNNTSGSAAPAFTTAPSVATVTVKLDAGTDTLKAGGNFASGSTATDTATINTWNVVSVPFTLSDFGSTGDAIKFDYGWLGAANTNTHEYQLYFSPSTATCSGTGATLCDAGCQMLSSVTDTTSSAQEWLVGFLVRTGSNTQAFTKRGIGTITTGSTGSCSVTDSAATKLVIGYRNTSAGAATIQLMNYTVWYGQK